MLKNIYLVGFMGTGKTTVGNLLAKRLNREFVEMDTVIEDKEGSSIVEIFAKKGEPYFRELEKEVLKSIASKNNLVVSCGGGVVIDKENIKIMKASGIIVCLRAEAKTIYERTKHFKHRPLLNVAHPLARIEELLNIRKPFYEQADFFIDTDNLSLKEVVDKIVFIIEREAKQERENG